MPRVKRIREDNRVLYHSEALNMSRAQLWEYIKCNDATLPKGPREYEKIDLIKQAMLISDRFVRKNPPPEFEEPRAPANRPQGGGGVQPRLPSPPRFYQPQSQQQQIQSTPQYQQPTNLQQQQGTSGAALPAPIIPTPQQQTKTIPVPLPPPSGGHQQQMPSPATGAVLIQTPHQRGGPHPSLTAQPSQPPGRQQQQQQQPPSSVASAVPIQTLQQQAKPPSFPVPPPPPPLQPPRSAQPPQQQPQNAPTLSAHPPQLPPPLASAMPRRKTAKEAPPLATEERAEEYPQGTIKKRRIVDWDEAEKELESRRAKLKNK